MSTRLEFSEARDPTTRSYRDRTEGGGQSVERFIQNDPFTKAGLFAGIEVVRWRKAFFNKERLI